MQYPPCTIAGISHTGFVMSLEQGNVSNISVAPAAATTPAAAATPPPALPKIDPSLIQPFSTAAAQAQAAQQAQAQTPAGETYTKQQVIETFAKYLGSTPEELMQRLGNDNPLDAGGAAIRDAVEVIRERRAQRMQPTPAAAATPAPAATPVQPTLFDPNKLIPLPEGIEGTVIVKQGDVWVPTSEQYKQYADYRNHNELVMRRQNEAYARNPLGLLDAPEFQGKIQEMVKREAAAMLAAEQAEQVRNTYREKYAPVIFDGGVYREGLNGTPMLTPLGSAYIKHLDTLSSGGMKESAKLYELAMSLAEHEVGATKPPPPPATPGQPNRISTASQFLTAAQTRVPGTPPSRHAEPPTNLRGSLFKIASEVGATEDMTVEQIMRRAGSLLTAGSGRQ